MSLDDLESAYGYGGSREKALAAATSLDPSDTGPHGTTAVHIAAQHVDPEVLELLLSRGFRAGSWPHAAPRPAGTRAGSASTTSRRTCTTAP